MALTDILAPLDLSPASRSAVRLAAQIAKRQRAGLTLMHVDRMPAYGERLMARAPADVAQSYADDRAAAVRRVLEDMAATIDGVKTKVIVGRGDVVGTIVDHAAHERCDLVVLGWNGTGSLHHEWIGGVTFEVAARSPRPVLVVRRDASADAQLFRRPLVAVGLDRPVDAAVALADAICETDAPLDFVHVHESPSSKGKPAAPASILEARDHLRARRAERLEADARRLRKGPVSVHFDEAESASEAVFERIHREGHDLVIVGQRSGVVPSVTLGSMARRLLEHARISIAIVNE